jgi:peptidyl-prolyl cis-trans isomerase C
MIRTVKSSIERTASFRRSFRPIFLLSKKRGSIHPISLPYQGHLTALTVLLALLFLQACSISGDSESKNVITVGSTRIHLDVAKRDFEELLSDLPESARDQEPIKKKVLNQLVDHYLILEYGKKHHIKISDASLAIAIKRIRNDFTDEGFEEAMLRDYIDFDQWKEQLRNRLLEKKIVEEVSAQVPPPDHAAVLHYYETHASDFRVETQVKFRQVVTNDLQEAKNILKRIQQGENFAALAREYSIAPEAGNGGLVGWVTKGELEKTMDTALFSLKPGHVSPVIHSPYGYHLFQVLESRSAGIQPLPEVTRQIEEELARQRRLAFLEGWLKDLRKQFKVQVNPNILQILEQ